MLGKLAQAVQLAVMEETLCSSQDRVIVDYHGSASGLYADPGCVNGCGTGYDAVAGSAALQVQIVAPRALCRNRQLAIFLKAVLVDQIIEIFTGRAIPCSMPSDPRLGAVFVLGASQALAQRL